MATKSAKKVTTVVNGVPHTSTVKSSGSSGGSSSGDAQVAANQAAAAKLGISIPGVGGGSSSSSAPHSDGSWIDPIRAPGDTHARTGNDVANDDGTTTFVPGKSTLPNQEPNPAIPTQVQNRINGVGSSSLNSVGGIADAPVAPTPPPSKYAAGLAAANASGVPAPSDAGEARYAAKTYTPADQPDTSATDALISSDPGITSLMQGITQMLNPAKQSTTLLQDYQKLYKKSGLDEINQELIDADTVINGTEDDIRNEIQGAGGFGTESQVQAMSLARNKGLLKRYNQLVQMKTDATNQLNTMSNLNAQDKQMAQQRVDSQINAMFKLADFRQQAQKNVQEAFNNMVARVGYAGAYQAYASDPVRLGQIEQTMGLNPGGLQSLASQRDLDREAKIASINASNASTANSYSEIAARNNPANKPLTALQAQVLGYADRTNQSDSIISKLGNAMASMDLKSAVGQKLPDFLNFAKPAEVQQYQQAQRDFVNAVLRRESGAAIGKDEFSSAQQQYFPQIGDTPEVIQQKEMNRQTVINNLYQQSNSDRGALPGQIIEKDGQKYQVGDDGISIKPI